MGQSLTQFLITRKRFQNPNVSRGSTALGPERT
jgi:hypothetical protein